MTSQNKIPCDSYYQENILKNEGVAIGNKKKEIETR